ncbi:hypothetical protein HMY34_01410 [Thiothrix subterranea]|uniref:hypothetical protein n=1 Tax=Thiothrix subterranea TaxID=2735563 RepID=UPI00192AC2BA|nr:hypothetical protein [Thiothrix subterranea]QQZ27521.1 hypothetical protein HMY34_01410 [Thiothrix subterranea]
MLIKERSEWSNAPLWVKVGLWAVPTRNAALLYEKGSAIVGVASFIASFVFHDFIFGTIMLGAAYMYAITVRWVDNKGLW